MIDEKKLTESDKEFLAANKADYLRLIDLVRDRLIQGRRYNEHLTAMVAGKSTFEDGFLERYPEHDPCVIHCIAGFKANEMACYLRLLRIRWDGVAEKYGIRTDALGF